MRERPELVIGWREWVALPALDVRWIKAKVDTGARTSSLHVFDLEVVARGGKRFAHFSIHPYQRSDAGTVRARAEVLEYRRVTSSNGHSEERPVIETALELAGETWPIELTLANRSHMGFRMLLGRQSFRDRAVVDAGSSFYGGKPPAKATRRAARPK